MKALKNDTNDCSKRTATKIKSILKSNGLSDVKPENQGDGNVFCIPNDLNSRIALRKAGFILIKTLTDKYVYFKCH